VIVKECNNIILSGNIPDAHWGLEVDNSKVTLNNNTVSKFLFRAKSEIYLYGAVVLTGQQSFSVEECFIYLMSNYTGDLTGLKGIIVDYRDTPTEDTYMRNSGGGFIKQ
jgi:hypothetical protein